MVKSPYVRAALLVALFSLGGGIAARAQAQPDLASQLAGSYRFERSHWIYVHLQGPPRQLGYQHGWLLAPEIADALPAVKLEETHSTKRDWQFFRTTAEKVLWPHIDAEYREELQGIAHGAQVDLWNIVALNAMEEVPDYYVPWLDKQQEHADILPLKAPGNCSAFVATGTWTKDHQPVIAHNNWTSFMVGERWRTIFDIVPARGQRILMDGFPGSIASSDDFGINASQLAVTETTITGFSAFDPKGKPEFVRARKALQYATSIDEYVRIFLDQNNGGYANDWLLADYKTGEVARFEVGLKRHRFWRTKDGYFAGANFPSDPDFIKAETDFDPANQASSPNARHRRWDELMAQYKGTLDVGVAQKLLADHRDSFEGREDADEHSLCGHVQSSPRGLPEWDWAPFTPGGAVSAKAADSSLVKSLAFRARAGQPCGHDFLAGEFLRAHPEFLWQAHRLCDMKGNPWAQFKVDDK